MNFRQFFYGYDYPDMQLDSDTHIKDDLGGAMSVKFKPGSSFNAFCSEHIENYNPDRYEILAIRVFYGKDTYITLYAVDRSHQEKSPVVDKIPVKKFKLNTKFLADLIPFIEECNFTLTTGSYPLSDMEVIHC
ncbi:MAG TPA: hypothetical protein VK177_13595 [Flavobacteriales bacterium]|nr:hypothetical protein [Flavobacteriales bacterium]